MSVHELRHAELFDVEFAPGGREQVRFIRTIVKDPSKDKRDGAMLYAVNGVVTRVWRFHLQNLKQQIERLERGIPCDLDREMDPHEDDDS